MAVTEFMQRASSRKFIAAMAVLAAATTALAFDLITALIWRDVVLGTVGIYITGNVAQKALAK
jgi:hypothetical protein